MCHCNSCHYKHVICCIGKLYIFYAKLYVTGYSQPRIWQYMD